MFRSEGGGVELSGRWFAELWAIDVIDPTENAPPLIPSLGLRVGGGDGFLDPLATDAERLLGGRRDGRVSG